jgi:predicted nicotinamide N-methyase
MNYPITFTKIDDTISIYAPTPGLVKSHYQDLLKDDKNTPFPFWAKVWPSSIAMKQFLMNHPQWIFDKTVLEIGAGIGLPSLGIAKLTNKIIISDYIQEAVELIQKNISFLKFNNATAIQLDWNAIPTNIKGDTIILSDVNYAPADFDALLLLMKRFLQNKSTLIIATPQRIMANPFVQSLQSFIKETEEINIDYQNENVLISIFVLFE